MLGPFIPGIPKLASLGVPTTITLNVGQRYSVVVEGVYDDSSGNAAAEYWQAIDFVATVG